MDLRAQVERWVEWSSKNLPTSGEIPKINSVDPVPPWIEDFSETVSLVAQARQETIALFVEKLAADAAIIPTRFTALHLFRALAGETDIVEEDFFSSQEIRIWVAKDMGYDEAELEMGEAEVSEEYAQMAAQCTRKADKMIKEFSGDLVFLVRLLKVEEVPNDWRLNRWEILNSYAISDWERALKLYNRAEELGARGQADLQFMRGRFNYLRVFGEAIEIPLASLSWTPEVSVGDSEQELLLLLSGLRLSECKVDVTDAARNALRDAANDLEKALESNPGLFQIYGPVLARSWFFTGHPETAESLYKQGLNIWAAFPTIKRWIYESLGVIYQDSDQPERLIEILEAFAGDFAGEKGVNLRIAELKAKQSHFESVPESLRRELDVNPEADRDWRISTLLALAETRDVSARLISELKSNPPLWRIAEGLTADFWPAFSKLTDEAREEWIAGTIFWHETRDDPLRTKRRRKAVHSYATAVELELNARVFTRFRDHVEATPRSRDVASSVDDSQEKLKPFADFILRNRPFALGQMLHALDKCRSSPESLLVEFRKWVERECPPALAHVSDLYQIKDARNTVAHGGSPARNVEDIPSLCRQVLESLAHRASAPRASAQPRSGV